MTDRMDPGGGGLTGVTGDLTPDDAAEPFVPAERREQAGEEEQGSVTYRRGTAAAAQRGDIGQPGVEPPGSSALNRESGYGSQHGLSPEDPAYRMEVHPPSGASEGASQDQDTSNDGEPPAREPRQGVDEVADREERF